MIIASSAGVKPFLVSQEIISESELKSNLMLKDASSLVDKKLQELRIEEAELIYNITLLKSETKTAFQIKEEMDAEKDKQLQILIKELEKEEEYLRLNKKNIFKSLNDEIIKSLESF